MEKELTSNNNNFLSSKYGLTEMPSENFINCYLQQHQNWDAAQNDQTDFFDSALSSIVSSPASVPQSSNGGEGVMIRELIGRLGSICDSGDVSPQSCIAATTTTTTTTTTAATNNNGSNSSANNSCYSTPLNSPPSSNFNIPTLIINSGNFGFPIQSTLGSLNADPGFVERAAKFSCFGTFNGGVTATANNNNNINSYNGNNNISCNNLTSSLEPVKLSRVNSGKKLGENNGDSREGSSVSEQNTGGGAETACGVKAAQNDGNSRKRKSGSKAKVKETSITKDDKAEVENDESKDKRSKIEDDKKENAGETNKEEAKAEPLKDYIHVRARRGQATDSHSLAERVRREKISERMKFLQDLVPGCNKVTGKATVLDEIINYVQSLQRQVEFLSMKLSTVNPRMEFNMEALLSKDMLQSRGSSMQQAMYHVDQNSAQAFPYGYQSTQQMSLPSPNGAPNRNEHHFLGNPMNGTGIRRNPGIPLPLIDGFLDPMTQMSNLWEDDLQSIVQMGITQNQSQNVPTGSVPNAQMKVEL